MEKKKAIRNPLGDRFYHTVSLFVLTLVMLMIIFPIWTVVIASFSDPTELYQKTFLIWPSKITLESYELVFRDSDFLTGMYNSVCYTVVGTLVNVVMNICAAYPLSKRDHKGKNYIML